MAAGKENEEPPVEGLSEAERFKQQVLASQKVVAAQRAAEGLRAKATKCLDPQERRRMMQEAYDREVEAHGHSKWAKRLQSGPWQGAAGGAGIGAGIAAGLGTVTGTLVGTVLSIPTVLVGGLVGAGVGGIHGSWFKLEKSKGGKPKSEEELRAEAMKEAEVLDAAVERSSKTPPPPSFEDEDQTFVDKLVSTKKKPRKLEVRSPISVVSPATGSPISEKRKPRKLDSRSSIPKT